MRKHTLLTSFVLDEITAQARYRNLLDAAERRRLSKIARANQPRWRDRLLLTSGERLVAWGLWVKGQAAPASQLDDAHIA
jgi:hypothetical protein